jgi:hypothetical protein
MLSSAQFNKVVSAFLVVSRSAQHCAFIFGALPQ